VFPLLASLGCGSGTFIDALCVIPREWWLLIWAGLIGSFIGLTIRLVLERRRFQREAASRPSA
jgi:RsiW-degrading membrane proteinase PrsW (M82 family)